MGSTDNTFGWAMYDTPVHEVTLAGFEIGAYEVTQAQYAAVMGTNPSYYQGPGTENNPVEMVNWYEAREFCTQLSAQTGRTFTLPSEAQWEYACRAGSTTLYSFGDDDGQLGNYAWYGANSNGITHPVGTKLPNVWGLYDMHGNVLEWCLDSWHSDYTGAPTDGSAWEPETGPTRMVRGGCFAMEAWLCRSAIRLNAYTESPSFTRGFRVVAVPAGG
jgi:formylglycine-generating enzyme required for sulfatase activity